MKKYLFGLIVLSILVFSSAANAANINIPADEIITNKTCQTSSLLWTNSSVQYNIDGNATQIEKIRVSYCPDGCSTKLNDCRPTQPVQLLMFSAIIIGIIVMIFFFDYLGWAGYALDMVLIVIPILIASYDMFSSAWMTTMFWIIPFVLFSAIIIRFAYAERKPDGSEPTDDY